MPHLNERHMLQLRISIVLLFLTATVFGQEMNIAQFAIWKPKDGQRQNFENGYKQHLDWHKANGDQWGWHGWFVISGIRYGQFVDATFGHSWADFDKAVKPAEDRADNGLHVFPFGDVQIVFKASLLPEYSTEDTFDNKLRLVKFLTIDVGDMDNGLKIINRLKDFYVSKKIKSFKTYQVIDGDSLNQLILMLGFDSWEEYSLSETFSNMANGFEKDLKIKPFKSITSETWAYRADMSWFPE